MSLVPQPLLPNTNNPQGMGHPNVTMGSLTVSNNGQTGAAGSSSKVLILQTDNTTPGQAASLLFEGGDITLPGGSQYVLSKATGPSAGFVNQDHLQLFRYGPTGASAPIAEVFDIGAKMLPSVDPVVNTMTLYADLALMGGNITNNGAENTGAKRGFVGSRIYTVNLATANNQNIGLDGLINDVVPHIFSVTVLGESGVPYASIGLVVSFPGSAAAPPITTTEVSGNGFGWSTTTGTPGAYDISLNNTLAPTTATVVITIIC